MWEKFKQTWRRLKAANPGQRFQQEFRRRHGAGRSPIQKALLIVGGLLLMAAGSFFSSFLDRVWSFSSPADS